MSKTASKNLGTNCNSLGVLAMYSLLRQFSNLRRTAEVGTTQRHIVRKYAIVPIGKLFVLSHRELLNCPDARRPALWASYSAPEARWLHSLQLDRPFSPPFADSIITEPSPILLDSLLLYSRGKSPSQYVECSMASGVEWTPYHGRVGLPLRSHCDNKLPSCREPLVCHYGNAVRWLKFLWLENTSYLQRLSREPMMSLCKCFLVDETAMRLFT